MSFSFLFTEGSKLAMPRFKKHYTREEARQLLPLLEGWLADLVALRDELRETDPLILKQLAAGGDLGGEFIKKNIDLFVSMKETLLHFQRREIQIKDIDRGLIDFPAYIGGKEVFLCWEKGEDDIEFWHDLDTGYAGREKL